MVRYTLYPATGTLQFEGGTQLKSTSCGLPVPLRATVAVGFVDELLVTVRFPVAEPTVVGSKVSVRESVLPGLRVAGRVTDDTEKPLPDIAIVFTVTAAVPLEVSVIV